MTCAHTCRGLLSICSTAAIQIKGTTYSGKLILGCLAYYFLTHSSMTPSGVVRRAEDNNRRRMQFQWDSQLTGWAWSRSAHNPQENEVCCGCISAMLEFSILRATATPCGCSSTCRSLSMLVCTRSRSSRFLSSRVIPQMAIYGQ